MTLTKKGEQLEKELTSTQMARFNRAYNETDTEAIEGFRRVLRGIINPQDRARVRPRTGLSNRRN